MNNKTIGLTILLWVEVIISARALLFTVPVLINRNLKPALLINNVSDWAVVVITIIAIFYFLTGIASLLGFKAWKLFHYIGAVLTFVLTAGLVNKILSVETSVNPLFFVPAVLSIVFAVLITRGKSVAQPA